MGTEEAASPWYHSESRRSLGVTRLGRDLPLLVVLGFLMFVLTGLFQTVVPYATLARQAKNDPEVATQLKGLETLGAEQDPFDLTPDELQERVKILGPLFVRVPWGKIALAASFVIVFPLGWLAGRFMKRPEFSGLLLMLSVGTGQNPALIPRGMEYLGMGEMALPFGQELSLVLFQFVLLGMGIFSHSRVRETE